MKLLIGILYCGENEYKQCREAIRKQTYQNYDVFVIENRPNKEAHDLLYQRFMENADTCDIFIKIDADMVLRSERFFEKMLEEVKKHPDVERFSFAVHDYFTDRLIFGLHAFKSSVTFRKNIDGVYTDRVDNTKNQKDYADEDEFLVPAAYHCPNPSEKQAFHFGIHKAMKIVAKNNFRTIENIIVIYSIYKKTKNRLLGMAFLGLFSGVFYKINPEGISYNNKLWLKIYKKTSSLSNHKMYFLSYFMRLYLKMVAIFFKFKTGYYGKTIKGRLKKHLKIIKGDF